MTDTGPNPIVPARWAEAMGQLGDDAADELAARINRAIDPDETWNRVGPIIEKLAPGFDDEAALRRLAAIAINSRALSTTLAAHPEILFSEEAGQTVTLQNRSALVNDAGSDLAGILSLEEAMASYSDSIDSIVAAELDRARAQLAPAKPAAADIPFAIMAMGKWGARELNYSSDIDFMFVHGTNGVSDEEARTTALALASRIVSNLSSPTFDGPALVVDTNLRPEGSMGPLSRSLDSYRRYYMEWGDAWELQALLKTRHAAGDVELGRAFETLAEDVVWVHGLEPGALRSIRRIKERGESSADTSDIKRSRGGIRDIEFTVQVLQLVHGRLDPDLRVSATLTAIDALGRSSLIDEEDRRELADSYRFLRNLEHRIQLWELKQTHQLPSDETDLNRIGLSMAMPPPSGESLTRQLAQIRSRVRDIHERLYFRPILDALVGSPTARLDPEKALVRLQALGFANTAEATRAISELTAGTSRRSRVMNHLLPLMLDWLSLAPDPDMGLAQLRLLLAHTQDHSTLVSLLQTNPLAGERLCRLLGSGRLMGALIDRMPEFVPRLADDERINDIRDLEAATSRLLGLLDSRPDLEARIGTIRRFARRARLRIAARDVLGDASAETTTRSLSDSADAVMAGAVTAAGSPSGFLVVAMGRWGGRELSYESDLDLMYVYLSEDDREEAFDAAATLNHILSEPGRHGEAYELDAGLRPEGRSGAIARSVDGYLRYYGEWAEPWELLALIKARAVSGDERAGEELFSGLDEILWRPELPTSVAFEIRAIKARVEQERIPPGEDPDYHLKLGGGGLSDVEFLVQLLQLQHGGRDETLRSPNTMEALRALHEAEIFNDREHSALSEAYAYCTRVRLRLHLQLGRPFDSLPTDTAALGRLASSLGYERAADLRDHYRMVTRRARAVFERRFY